MQLSSSEDVYIYIYIYRLPECPDVLAFDRKQEYIPKETQINPKKLRNNSFCGSDGPPAIFGGTLQVNKFHIPLGL